MDGVALLAGAFGCAAAGHILCSTNSAFVADHVLRALAETGGGRRRPTAATVVGDDGFGRDSMRHQRSYANSGRGGVGHDRRNVLAFCARHGQGSA